MNNFFFCISIKNIYYVLIYFVYFVVMIIIIVILSISAFVYTNTNQPLYRHKLQKEYNHPWFFSITPVRSEIDASDRVLKARNLAATTWNLALLSIKLFRLSINLLLLINKFTVFTKKLSTYNRKRFCHTPNRIITIIAMISIITIITISIMKFFTSPFRELMNFFSKSF